MHYWNVTCVWGWCLCNCELIERERVREIVCVSVVTACWRGSWARGVLPLWAHCCNHTDIVIVCSLWAAVVFPLVWVFHVNILCILFLISVLCVYVHLCETLLWSSIESYLFSSSIFPSITTWHSCKYVTLRSCKPNSWWSCIRTHYQGSESIRFLCALVSQGLLSLALS